MDDDLVKIIGEPRELERPLSPAETKEFMRIYREDPWESVIYLASIGRKQKAREWQARLVQQRAYLMDGVLLGAAPWQTEQQFFEGPLPSEEVPRTDSSSQHRYERARTLCETEHGRIDVETMKRIMSDHIEEKDGLQNICSDQTIQSVLFLPSEGKMWVAQGTIPAPAGGHVEFSF